MYHFIQMCILSGFLIIGIIRLFSVIVFIIYYLCKYLKYDNDRSTKTFFITVYYQNFSPDNFDGIKMLEKQLTEYSHAQTSKNDRMIQVLKHSSTSVHEPSSSLRSNPSLHIHE